MRFEIEPKIGLGNFILGMNINQILTLIKRNGYKYKHCKIISGKEPNTPFFFQIPSESITLRFNYYSQNLELIEKEILTDEKLQKNKLQLNLDSEYYYKNKLFYSINKETHYHQINYQNIAKIFGLSKVPKKLNKNQNVFLEYSGIGFYFTNIIKNREKNDEIDSLMESSSVDTESILSKIFIFREDSLYESLNKMNNVNQKKIFIQFDSKNPKTITLINEDNKSKINIGDHIEDVLTELKHPNYIHYYNEQDDNYNNKENGNIFYNQSSNKIYYLNYFQYGLDIMINNNKVNRIILHTNQVEDSKFGIYDRCNFKLKLRDDYLKGLIETKDRNKNREFDNEHNYIKNKIIEDEYNNHSKEYI